MTYAETHGAKKEVLISCSGLKQAIYLYKKFGFYKCLIEKNFGNQKKQILKWKERFYDEAIYYRCIYRRSIQGESSGRLCNGTMAE